MLGAIAGDIIGSRFEFDSIYTTEFDLFHKDCMMTDDSVLAIAIAGAILENKEAPDFERWLRQTTIENRYAGYGEGFFRWAVTGKKQFQHGSWGNGSAMRVAPVGWVCNSTPEVMDLAKDSALPSHGHPFAVTGAQIIALGIYSARTGLPKERVCERMSRVGEYYIHLVEVYRAKNKKSGKRINEECVVAVPQAISCIRESTSYEDAVRLAVSLGNDSDTMGAIVGSIAEPLFGMPDEIKDTTWTYIKKNYPNLEGIVKEFTQLYCLCN